MDHQSIPTDIELCEIEQQAGPPEFRPVDPGAVDDLRRAVYQSYEKFLREQLEQLDASRPSLWNRDYSSEQGYLRSIQPMRERLKRVLGFWIEPSERLPSRTWDRETLYDKPDFIAERFRLEVRPGLNTYAIELTPKSAGSHPGLLVQHGYGGTPEAVCGFTHHANDDVSGYRSMGLRAVRRGFHVVAVFHPTSYGSLDDPIKSGLPDFPLYPVTYGKNRLHRLAILCGGALFGADMLATSRGVDHLVSLPNVRHDRIGLYGLSQGGMTAIYLPAMDERIRASVSSAFFNDRTKKMIGPDRVAAYVDTREEDKFLPETIRCFSDSDLVSLIAPRAFAVEAGLKDNAVAFEQARDEFQRTQVHYEQLGVPDLIEFIAHAEGHIPATRRAFEFLQRHLS